MTTTSLSAAGHGARGEAAGRHTAEDDGGDPPGHATAGGSPLVGRDAARTTTADVLEAGGAGGVVLTGEPGVGRTRMAREAVAIAGDLGRTTRWAAGTAAAAPYPLGALAHLLPPVDAGSDPLVLLQGAT